MPNSNTSSLLFPSRPKSSGFFSAYRGRASFSGVERKIQPLPLPKKLNIIFDLDGVLVANVYATEKELRQRKYHYPNYPLLLYFLRNTALFFTAQPYSLPQCVLPGVIELIQLLYSPEVAPFVEVSVFSAGADARNRGLYAAILTKALGKERSDEIMSRIKIRSRDDCEPSRPEQVALSQAQWGLEAKQTDFGKNIYKIINRDEKDHTLLIDDNPRSICHRQVANYCAAPSVHLQTFDPLLHGESSCDSAESLLFQQLNSVFYLTAVITDLVGCFKTGQQNHSEARSVIDRLLQLHFERIPKMPTGLVQRYRPRFQENFALQHMYDKGLEILKRTINPELSFVNYGAIQAMLESPVTEQERIFLEKKPSVEAQEFGLFRMESVRSFRI